MIHSVTKIEAGYAIQLGKPDVDLDTGKDVTTPAGLLEVSVASLKADIGAQAARITSFQQTYDATAGYLKAIVDGPGKDDAEAKALLAEIEAK